MTLAFGAFMNFFKLCLSFSITLSGLVLFQPHSVQGAPVSERFFRFDAIDFQGQNHLFSQYDSQKARTKKRGQDEEKGSGLFTASLGVAKLCGCPARNAPTRRMRSTMP